MPTFSIVRRSSAVASEDCGDPNLTNLPSLLWPSATEDQVNAILHCTVLTGDFGDRTGLKVANRTADCGG
jgi:hypothetical protein